MSPPAQRATVIRSLAAALAARAPGTAVSADESTTSHRAAGRHRPLDRPRRRHGRVPRLRLSDGGARCARSRHGAARAPAPRLEMTEVCCSTGSGFARGYNPGMADGIWLADTIWRNLSAGGASSFSWWTALSPELGCPPATDPACPAGANPSRLERRPALLRPRLPLRRQPVDLLHPPLLGARQLQPLHPPRRGALPGRGRPLRRARARLPAQHLAVRADQRPPRARGRSRVRLLPPGAGRAYGQPTAYTTSATSDLAAAAAPVLDPVDAHGHDHPARAQRDDGHRPR